ncbi:hypothetical protein R1flu_006468 [Riccia fluitans]|uniref:Uncharacterized protein n=1 Tax=Riccia fluitans TaxID=41844 RepID=A0ABD1YYV4_9MARC
MIGMAELGAPTAILSSWPRGMPEDSRRPRGKCKRAGKIGWRCSVGFMWKNSHLMFFLMAVVRHLSDLELLEYIFPVWEDDMRPH